MGGEVLDNLNFQKNDFKKEALIISALKCALANGDDLNDFQVPGLTTMIEVSKDSLYLFCDGLTFQVHYAGRQLLNYSLL